jgi:hypothetical protein
MLPFSITALLAWVQTFIPESWLPLHIALLLAYLSIPAYLFRWKRLWGKKKNP